MEVQEEASLNYLNLTLYMSKENLRPRMAKITTLSPKAPLEPIFFISQLFYSSSYLFSFFQCIYAHLVYKYYFSIII